MKKGLDLSYIYNLHVVDLFTYGCYLGFDRELVKDAIHDVFVKFKTDETLLKDISNIKFYLFKALKNRLFDIQKRNIREVAMDNFQTFEEMPFDIQVDVEEQFIEEEEQIEVKQNIEMMLNTLTKRQREIIYLRYVQEYDYDEISELLNISVHGCRKLVSKSIISLREKFGPLMALLLIEILSKH